MNPPPMRVREGSDRALHATQHLERKHYPEIAPPGESPFLITCLMMNPTDESLRAARRRSWPVRRYSLGGEPGPDLSETTTARERLDMVWELTLRAWALAGRALPDDSRASMPIRKVALDSSGGSS